MTKRLETNRRANPKFDTVSWISALNLREQPNAQTANQAVDLDKQRVPNGLRIVEIDRHSDSFLAAKGRQGEPHSCLVSARFA
ncbi:MAG: hypothetical protein NTY15_09955 [Planctomycetota bacterium]|nr:hypothetical protein [Planctomycetota bacterium]